MKLVNIKKAPIWVDLVICVSQARFFNHWALITFDQTDWYNQMNQNWNCHLVHVTVWMKSRFMGSKVPYFQCKSDVFCMPFRNYGMNWHTLRLLITPLVKLIYHCHSAYINLARLDCLLQSLCKTYPLHSDNMPP